MLHEYEGKWPRLGARVYVAEGAQIVGDVEIGDDSSVWYNCVIRDTCPLILKDYVTVGHGVMMHGCTVESHCLIGMRAILLNGAVVGEYSIIGAGALITERTVIPPRSLVLGLPAKVKRALTDQEVASIDEYARRYYEYKETYLGMKAK